LATEQVAAEAIGDREWVAIDTIAGFEMSLEVRAPHIVGCQDLTGRFARMADGTALAFLGDQSVALEDVARCRARWEVPLGVETVR